MAKMRSYSYSTVWSFLPDLDFAQFRSIQTFPDREPSPASSLGCPLGWLILSCIFELVSLFLRLCLSGRGMLGRSIDGIEGHWLLADSDEIVLYYARQY